MRIHEFLMIMTVSLLLAAGVGCTDSSTNAAGMTDDELEESIDARIESDTQLRAYDIDVDADADENKVTISGTVPTQDMRTRAVDLAKGGRTDLIVTDEIKVDASRMTRADYSDQMAREERENAARSGERIGDQVDDAWIHTKVRTKLVGQGELPLGGINVDVDKNIVTLRGTVESQKAKAEAERLAKETEGVAQVRNQLVVKAGG
jgi:hyperosmotically inducible protein